MPIGDGAPGGLRGHVSVRGEARAGKLVVRKLTAGPSKPKAGKPFALRLQATRSDTGAAVKGGRVTCVARVGSAALRAKSGAFVGNQAVCVWAIPASAKGKTFRGSVTIVFEGLKAAKSFSGESASPFVRRFALVSLAVVVASTGTASGGLRPIGERFRELTAPVVSNAPLSRNGYAAAVRANPGDRRAEPAAAGRSRAAKRSIRRWARGAS